MTHAYHPACGCSACCDDEQADERRDDYIDQFAPAAAKALLCDESFAEGATNDLSNDVLASFATELGTFFAQYHGAADVHAEAAAGYALYRTLKPYMEAAALDRAKDEVAEQYDRAEAA